MDSPDKQIETQTKGTRKEKKKKIMQINNKYPIIKNYCFIVDYAMEVIHFEMQTASGNTHKKKRNVEIN